MDEKRVTVAKTPSEQVKPPLPSRIEEPFPGKAVPSKGSPPQIEVPESRPSSDSKIERTSSWFSHMWNWFLSS